jgi:hypothetical protein
LINFSFNQPNTRLVDQPTSAAFADKNGHAIYPVSTGTGTTGCNGTTHLFDPNGADGEQLCAASIINASYRTGSNFGLATGRRENGWRQLQYGLKFTF